MMDFTYFRQPIGNDEENASGVVWCGLWFDATGFGTRYRIGSPYEALHTGADLNCNPPGHFDADKLAPVYSIGKGIITAASRFKSWGNVIVARYTLEDGRNIWARYAHVDVMFVGKGDSVGIGQQIARIGNAFNTMAYHLHFDICPSGRIEQHPDDWPKLDKPRLLRDYADPKVWLQARVKPAANTKRLVEITADVLLVRNYSAPRATIVGKLKRGDRVTILNAAPVVNVYHWVRLDGDQPNRWIASEYTRDVRE